MSYKLDVIDRKYGWIVRPVGALGTCGFYPKAWQAAIVKDQGNVIDAFLKVNQNWTREEVTI